MSDSNHAPSTTDGPEAGFGSLWRKLYWVDLDGLDLAPEAVLAEWKRIFGDLWPGANRFVAPITGLQPGEIAAIELEVASGIALSTNVRLRYSSDNSFSLAAPPGHVFCGWTTFSAFVREHTNVAQVEVLMRASDPVFEIGLILGGHRREDAFWHDVLTNLARHFGTPATPHMARHCEDRRYKFRNIGNIRHNTVLRNGLHRSTDTLRRLTRRRKRPIDPNGSIT